MPILSAVGQKLTLTVCHIQERVPIGSCLDSRCNGYQGSERSAMEPQASNVLVEPNRTMPILIGTHRRPVLGQDGASACAANLGTPRQYVRMSKLEGSSDLVAHQIRIEVEGRCQGSNSEARDLACNINM